MPVFVDASGRRHRRARGVVAGGGALCVGFVALVMLGLGGAGPLSGSPLLSPVQGALDDLGIPRPLSSPPPGTARATPSSATSPLAPGATAGALPRTSSGSVAAPAGPSSAGPASTAPSPRPSTPPSASPTTPAGPAPTPKNPGSTHRASPTPNGSGKPTGPPGQSAKPPKP